MILSGKISKFGGPTDSLNRDLAFYQHWECDLRPDLFYPKSSDPLQDPSARLRNLQAFYIALNIEATEDQRSQIHESLWKVSNFKTGQFVLAQLVERGPSAHGRLVDGSDVLLSTLRLDTDDDARVEEISKFNFKFGLYKS